MRAISAHFTQFFQSHKKVKDHEWIAGLDRGLAILEGFDHATPRMTATQAAQRTGLTRSAARRYLLTLEHLGYVYRDGKQFGLTPRVLKVGWSYFESAELPRLLLPFLQRVTARLNESVYVSVLDDMELVFIARNGATHVMTSGFVLGARLQPHLASPGIVLLAHEEPERVRTWLAQVPLRSFTPHTIMDWERLYAEVEQARALGYAVLEQQLQIGVRGIAIPLKNRGGQLVGAMSVSMPIGSESRDAALARVLPVLQETANALLNHL